MGRLGAAYDARRVIQGGAKRRLLRPSGKSPNKHHMNPNEPGKPFGIQVRIEVHKGLEHLTAEMATIEARTFCLSSEKSMCVIHSGQSG
jgi:hypothetical protein